MTGPVRILGGWGRRRGWDPPTGNDSGISVLPLPLPAPRPSRIGHHSHHPSSPSAGAGQSPQTQCRRLWRSLVTITRGRGKGFRPFLGPPTPLPSRPIPESGTWAVLETDREVHERPTRGSGSLNRPTHLIWYFYPSPPPEGNTHKVRGRIWMIRGTSVLEDQSKRRQGAFLTWYRIR